MFESYPSPYAPLEGTTPAPRAIFVDRWGTLLEVPEQGYPRSAEDVRFFPGVPESLFRMARAGWLVYLLGNEEAVARGEVTEAAWREVEAFVVERLERAGVTVASSYAGLDQPDSVYHLPNTGAFYHAAHTDGVALEKSWVIGDSTLELVAGWRAGCRQIGVRTGLALEDATYKVDPEFVADDLAAALRELLLRQHALHP